MAKFKYKGRLITAATKEQAIRKAIAKAERGFRPTVEARSLKAGAGRAVKASYGSLGSIESELHENLLDYLDYDDFSYGVFVAERGLTYNGSSKKWAAEKHGLLFERVVEFIMSYVSKCDWKDEDFYVETHREKEGCSVVLACGEITLWEFDIKREKEQKLVLHGRSSTSAARRARASRESASAIRRARSSAEGLEAVTDAALNALAAYLPEGDSITYAIGANGEFANGEVDHGAYFADYSGSLKEELGLGDGGSVDSVTLFYNWFDALVPEGTRISEKQKREIDRAIRKFGESNFETRKEGDGYVIEHMFLSCESLDACVTIDIKAGADKAARDAVEGYKTQAEPEIKRIREKIKAIVSGRQASASAIRRAGAASFGGDTYNVRDTRDWDNQVNVHVSKKGVSKRDIIDAVAANGLLSMTQEEARRYLAVEPCHDSSAKDVVELDVSHSVTKRGPARTEELLVLQGNYGYGWDDLCFYSANDPKQSAECRKDLKTYRENERNASHRVIRRRVQKDVDSLTQAREGMRPARSASSAARRARASAEKTSTFGNVTFTYCAGDVVEAIRSMGWSTGYRYVFTDLLGFDKETVEDVCNKEYRERKARTYADAIVNAIGEDKVAKAVGSVMFSGGAKLDELLKQTVWWIRPYNEAKDRMYETRARELAREYEDKGFKVKVFGNGKCWAVLAAKKTDTEDTKYTATGIADSEVSSYSDHLSRNFIGCESVLTVISEGRCEGINYGEFRKNVDSLSREVGALRMSDMREATEAEANDPSITWNRAGAGKYSRFAINEKLRLWRPLTADEFYHGGPRRSVKASSGMDSAAGALARYLGIDASKVGEADDDYSHFEPDYTLSANGGVYVVYDNRRSAADAAADDLGEKFRYDYPILGAALNHYGWPVWSKFLRGSGNKRKLRSLFDELNHEEFARHMQQDWCEGGAMDLSLDYRAFAEYNIKDLGPEWHLAQYDGKEMALDNGMLAYRVD